MPEPRVTYTPPPEQPKPRGRVTIEVDEDVANMLRLLLGHSSGTVASALIDSQYSEEAKRKFLDAGFQKGLGGFSSKLTPLWEKLDGALKGRV